MVMLEVPILPDYRPQAEDISRENDRFEFALLRQKSATERLAMGQALIRGARRFSLHCLGQQFAHLSPLDFAKKIAIAWLQENYPVDFIPTGNTMTWIQDSIALAQQLHNILENLGIRYYITGGVATIADGDPRTTRNLDLVLEIDHRAIEPLVEILEQEGFYVPGVADVLAGRLLTLGITHRESISRADLIISSLSEFERLKLARRRLIELPEGDRIYFISPEDLILAKLIWAKISQSEKQLRDVLGIIKVQSENLDYLYLHKWANQLAINLVFNQVCQDAGIRID